MEKCHLSGDPRRGSEALGNLKEQSVLGKGNSQCKDPEAVACLVCLRKQGGQYGQSAVRERRIIKDKIREVMRPRLYRTLWATRSALAFTLNKTGSH